MIIVDDVEQGSDEWFDIKLGVASASRFSDIITASTMKPSSSDEGYMYELVGEYCSRKREDSYSNANMDIGTEREAEARTAYEFVTGTTMKQVGFVYKDEKKLVGCSPDGLSRYKGLEIKCPLQKTHVKYLDKGGCPLTYVPQVQGSMWVTGLKKWDFMSYHPWWPPLIITVERDPAYQEALDIIMKKFLSTMLATRSKAKAFLK